MKREKILKRRKTQNVTLANERDTWQWAV